MVGADKSTDGQQRILCSVAVCRPVRRLFTYLLPPRLQKVVSACSRVQIPFGHSDALGFVIDVFPEDEDNVLPKLKSVLDVIDVSPPLPENHLELASWMAEQYLCSTGEALNAMVPARHINRADALVRLKLDYEACLRRIRKGSKRQLQLLELLKDGPKRRQHLITRGSWVSQALRTMNNRGFLEEYREEDESFASEEVKVPKCADELFATLTDHQQEVFNSVSSSLDDNQRTKEDVFLLHGVTGSGKTEVYLHLIRKVINEGKSAIFLVPEISLTVPMIRTFRQRFGPCLALLHSRLTQTERYREWMRAKRGVARVVLGARSAIFAPIKEPALFILDEEGEGSYKQQDTPRYHARSVALQRARATGAVVLLGSATPSLESYYKATRGDWHYLTLPERINQRPMPHVTVVDMSEEFAKKRNRSIFSMALKEHLNKTFAGDGQALLFLNRRGHSTYVFCRSCSYVCICKDCEIPMTYHFTTGWLRCHHCDKCERTPPLCPECGSKAIRYCGAGTQKVEEEFRLNYPQIPYSRMDSDTTSRRRAHETIFDEFEQGRTRCLIGTQMVARGFDFHTLDTAGIINADSTLNLPDFRSAERTFQLVAQVAGRVGRGQRPSQVVVQTYNPEHPAMVAAANHDYRTFAEEELPLREELMYPPFSRLVVVVAENKSDEKAQDDLINLSEKLEEGMSEAFEEGTLSVVGPGPAFIYRAKNIFRWQLLIKLQPRRPDLFSAMSQIFLAYSASHRSKIKINVDPVHPV